MKMSKRGASIIFCGVYRNRNQCFGRIVLVLGAIYICVYIYKNIYLTRDHLPLCPETPPNLVSKVNIVERLRELETNTSILQNVLPGGTYIPPHCKSRERLAILVPYRDREEQLNKFIPYMHTFLQKQQVHYTIFVAEMVQGKVFNTGLIQNVAFVTSDKAGYFTCFVFNDVDLLPTNENNFFRCADVPVHLCHSNGKYNYSLPYPKYFGGSIALRRKQFIKVNGFSNLFFGWGSQDDDMTERIENVGYKWIRVPKDIGVYDALEHGFDDGNPYNHNKDKLFADGRNRMSQEGLNSLQYRQVALEQRQLYTWVLVDVDQEQITKDYKHLYQKSHSITGVNISSSENIQISTV